MRSKKGASAVVAWVLLLGFTIGLATTVFLWTTRQTEEMSKSAVKFVEGGMQCDDVMINVAVSVPCNLKIINTRYLNISQLSIRKLLPADPKSFIYKDKVLEPQSKDKPVERYTASVDMNPVGYCGEVEVMPIINVDDELVGCKNKALKVNCNSC